LERFQEFRQTAVLFTSMAPLGNCAEDAAGTSARRMPVTDPQLVSCSIAIDRIANGTVDAFGAGKTEG
jgi:hypothetical protein